jgi:large subunit ribosomal protein L15
MKLHTLKPPKGQLRNASALHVGKAQVMGVLLPVDTKGLSHALVSRISAILKVVRCLLQMRLPKVGFKNPNRQTFVPINLDRLQEIAEKYGTKND